MTNRVFGKRARNYLVAIVPLFAACASSGEPVDEAVSVDNVIAVGERTVTLKTTVGSRYLSAVGGGFGALNAEGTVAEAWETFTLVDENGGALMNGDTVFLRTNGGSYLQADRGGGAVVSAKGKVRGDWERFVIASTRGTGPIRDNDVVGLQAMNRQWVSAAGGGGSAVFAYGNELRDWERFTIDLDARFIPPPPTPNWRLDWSDEFNGIQLDRSKWTPEVLPAGTYNGELQRYTDSSENARIEQVEDLASPYPVRALVIEARSDNRGGYTSARLKSTMDRQYGKLEIRAKLPSRSGTWPAIWMLPFDYGTPGVTWPVCGEIDIMEHLGHEPGLLHATVHTTKYNHTIGTQRTETINAPSAVNAFHVYAVAWTPQQIEVFLDGAKYFTFPNEGGPDAWPYDKPFHLILNLAVGGDWGGNDKVHPSEWGTGQRMEIDYVRAYKDANAR